MFALHLDTTALSAHALRRVVLCRDAQSITLLAVGFIPALSLDLLAPEPGWRNVFPCFLSPGCTKRKALAFLDAILSDPAFPSCFSWNLFLFTTSSHIWYMLRHTDCWFWWKFLELDGVWTEIFQGERPVMLYQGSHECRGFFPAFWQGIRATGFKLWQPFFLPPPH